MNCKDFREIADSYLSDELLVETNHDVLRHLEQCANCRYELSARRELRERLRAAVKNSSRSQINPAFAVRVKANLQSEAKRKVNAWGWANSWGTKPIFAGLAILAMLFIAGVIWQNWQIKPKDEAHVNPATPLPANTNIESVNSSLPVQNASFVKVKNDAVDDHKFCALKFSLEEKPITLEEAAKRFEKYNKDLDASVIKPLQAAFGNQVKLLEAHSCIVNGRRFAHVVLQYQNRLISVLVTKREDFGDDTNNSNAISCQSADGFQVACFETAQHSVFVISDLTETENLKIARTISPSLKKHIEQV